MMRQAALTQIYDRSLEGWREAARTWIMSVARTNPARLLGANFGPEYTTKMEGGQLMLHHPEFG
jgi:hypothetical protein